MNKISANPSKIVNEVSQSAFIGQSPIFEEKFKIVEARLRCIEPINLPHSFQDATMGPFSTYAMSSIRLTDADGNYGEVPTFSSNEYIFNRFLFPQLFNDEELTYAELYKKMYWAIRNEGFRGSASTALGQLDYALYDLAARRNGLALHKYVGAERDFAKAYASGGAIHWAHKYLIAECMAFVDQGFDTIKIKVGLDGGQDIKGDVKRLKKIREAIGDKVHLAVDANQVWNPSEALDFAMRISDLDISWFEEPCHSADLTAIETICRDSPIPVSYGESEKTSKVFPFLARVGVKHFQPITGYLSSIAEWFEVAQLAHQNSIDFSSGGFSQMNCQMVAACPETVRTEMLMALNGELNEFFEICPVLEGGMFKISNEVGSNLRIDWDYLKKKNKLEFDKSWFLNDFINHSPQVN